MLFGCRYVCILTARRKIYIFHNGIISERRMAYNGFSKLEKLKYLNILIIITIDFFLISERINDS